MIIALVTCYFPEEQNISNIFDIAKQVDLVVVCDNSNDSHETYFKNTNNIKYVFFGENLGLSLAFNRILKSEEINWQDDDYILFFDQDSRISESYINNLKTEYDRLLNQKYSIGCLGPVYFNNSSQILEIPKKPIKKIDDDTYYVQSIITSSMMIQYKILKLIGFWNEEIFLDMADWDLCWRINQVGKMCMMTKKVIMNHTLGIGEKHIGPLRIRIGSPIRIYYQTRDCLYLLKQKYTPVINKIMFIEMLTARPIVHFIFLKDKRQRIHYYKRGIEDYIKKVKGAYK